MSGFVPEFENPYKRSASGSTAHGMGESKHLICLDHGALTDLSRGKDSLLKYRRAMLRSRR